MYGFPAIARSGKAPTRRIAYTMIPIITTSPASHGGADLRSRGYGVLHGAYSAAVTRTPPPNIQRVLAVWRVFYERGQQVSTVAQIVLLVP